MIEINDYPDTTHWKTVQEFTLEQAALLLSGIDPLDMDLITVRKNNHPRWKHAEGFCLGLKTAIRRGTLTPVICYGEALDSFGWVNSVIIRNSDRSHDIDHRKTIITRDSLFDWIKKENIDYFIPRKIKIVNGIDKHSFEYGLDLNDDEQKLLPPDKENKTLLLPHYEHKSEGLEFVDDAIRQFWSTYDENDYTTMPTKQEVENYLISRGASKNLSKAVDLILRPNHLRSTGRRPKRKG